MDAPPSYAAVSTPPVPGPSVAPASPVVLAEPPQAAASPPPAPESRPAPIGPLPTQTPQWGHPLLYHNKLLVYPRYWTVCERCYNTGYKNAQASAPCGRCWRKFGREYSGALRAAYERPGSSTDLTGVHLQRPLERVPNTAPFSTYVSAPPAGPALPPRPVFDEDRYSDAPPRYDVVSHTTPNQPLPQQFYHSAGPPPAPGPYRVGPTIDWYSGRPPPGAVAVMPGDPRIGGVLCPQCGGSGTCGDLFSLFLGDSECDRCSGAGRINW
ncbi:hypothetical protein MCAP1_001613 [Malassezia caprae]|uniref:Uncharacterized protein n=1 Tax=Malassezia caprae TaxID=1381934 RepID=A0AAF0E873_9BASI|nr:hypothetical protein MCAP1_001613 [Malassezia caprae]